MEAELNFHPSVFAGTGFPSCDFEHPRLAEELIGPYTIKTTFYDRDHKQVTKAERPGRYGAVVEIIPKTGRPFRRHRTLFREAESFQWWRQKMKVSIELPKEMGIDPRVLAEQSKAVSEALKWRFVEAASTGDDIAILLAGLHETRPGGGPASVVNDVSARNRQWWVTMKRKLHGFDAKYPGPFVCPRPIEGKPAPVLRKGTAAEAGMKPDAVKRIDEICKAWAASGDQAFAVCLARHGVVFLHKAYGKRDGKAMTLTTPSWMASNTKLLSACLMMMLVDQGLADLDDDVAKFIPALRGVKVETPLTIRHLYTHTNGLEAYRGGRGSDLGEILAAYYPHLAVGKGYVYNGTGYALGGKVIEMVSGEAIPQFYKKHLLAPLGCENTRVTDTSGGASSVPMDIAKVAQMLLNRGAYGKMRFFSEKTFEKMLPRKLTKVLGPTGAVWGIGTHPWREDGQPAGSFGHGAASRAIFCVDPANDMITVMTRNKEDEKYNEYRARFFKALLGGIADSPVPAEKK